VATVDVSSSRCPGHVVVALGGELDFCGTGYLGRALGDAAASGSPIIVDLAELTFLDCAGLSVLISARREAQVAGGDLLLAAAGPAVVRLLSLIGQADELLVYASVREAASGAPQARAAAGPFPWQAEASLADGDAARDEARYVATEQVSTERRPS
jgi:anti-anti-sigma factor